MLWLLVIISAYFLFAVVSLVDRYLLAGPLPNPRAYAFYVGILGILALVLIPFGFTIPNLSQILLSLLAGAVWIFAIFLLYIAIFHSEVSRVVPAISGFLPVFTFIILLMVFPGKETIDFYYVLALFILIGGSFLISLKKFAFSWPDLKYSIFAAFMFAIGFFLMKLVYLEQPFISGFIWMRLGGVLAGVLFLISSETRKTIFTQKPITKKLVVFPFILGQAFAAAAFFLQNYSVSLAKISQIPFINALEGIRYVFLLFFIFILARKFPQLLKEEMRGRILVQKILAILLIGAGLSILAFK